MGKSGKSGGSKGAKMTGSAAARIQSAGDRNPGGPTGQSGFGPRAQSAAARGEAAAGTDGSGSIGGATN